MATRRITIASLQSQIAKLQKQLKRLSAEQSKKKKAKKKPKRKRAPKKRKKKITKKRVTKKKITKLVKKPKKKATKKQFKEGELIREEFRSLAVKLCETVQLTGLGACHWRSFQNADSSVDIEIRISIEVGPEDVPDKILDVEDIMPFMWPKQYWYIVGIQAEDENVTGTPTIDKRPHRAWLYPTHDLSSAILRLRTGLIPTITDWLTVKGRISDIIIRVHWNPWELQPKRPRR